jgi:phosphate transport system substrate-binding protein
MRFFLSSRRTAYFEGATLMLLKRLLLFAIFSFSLLFLAAPAAGNQTKSRVTICGTGDSQDLLRTLAWEFNKDYPDTEILVPESIGSSGGIRATAEGKCDLGRTARPLRGKETNYHLHYRLLAYSPVVFAANPSNLGVSGLTSSQIISVFSGKTTNWRELGGKDQPIYVATREKGDSCRTVLEDRFPGFADITTFAGETLFSTPKAVEVIGRYAGTIGYVPLAMTRNTNLRLMAIDGVAPTAANIRNGRYPYAIPLGMVWRGELSTAAQAFKSYLFSPKARSTIENYGSIPAF